MSDIPIYQVDSFTAEPFRGNPAGVCLLKERMSEAWQQGVAREMNLSETAFLLGEKDNYSLRWFTPATEVELCGHATLATAHILWEEGLLPSGGKACFHTLSGELYASRRGSLIELDFPLDPVQAVPPPEHFVLALGVEAVFTGRCRFDYLVEVDTEETLKTLKPDFRCLASASNRGVIVTSPCSSGRYDFVSRFFAPAVGVDEDPVTGSAHCALAPYWAEKLGKKEMTGFQASARGGVVRVRLGGDRVFIGGEAVTVLRGKLLA